MKLNLGCGHNRIDGFVNVDASPDCSPDQVWDLEKTPWPWDTSSATDIAFLHSLEHMGRDPAVFLEIMKEAYRVGRAGCWLTIQAPHPHHDDFINDPTHVRAVTPAVISLFDRSLNDRWREQGHSNTPLAHYTGVNIALVETTAIYDEPYAAQLTAGSVTEDELRRLSRERLNVIKEWRMRCCVLK